MEIFRDEPDHFLHKDCGGEINHQGILDEIHEWGAYSWCFPYKCQKCGQIRHECPIGVVESDSRIR